MDFYFAIDAEQLKINKISDVDDGSFIYKLNYNSYMFCTITATGGQCWDRIKQYQNEYNSVRPFAICKAKFKNDEDVLGALHCSMHGDRLTLEVIVSEITWFK